MEDTHLQLKKNVYQNYGQFIDTAKEISFLESEMYQLAHMITEQRNLLHELMDASVLGDKVKINIIKENSLPNETTIDPENFLLTLLKYFYSHLLMMKHLMWRTKV